MTMRKLIPALIAVFALPAFAQTTTTTSTTTAPLIRPLQLGDYGLSAKFSTGYFTRTAGPTKIQGLYYGLNPKVTHKPSNVALEGVAFINRINDQVTNERTDVFDNPQVKLSKVWAADELGAGSWISMVKAGVTSTLAGNRDTFARSFAYSAAPFVQATKQWSKISWRHTLAYGRGVYNQEAGNAVNSGLYGQDLTYGLTSNADIGLTGWHLSTSAGKKISRWGAVAEYRFNDNVIGNLYYGQTGGVNTDPQFVDLSTGEKGTDYGTIELTIAL